MSLYAEKFGHGHGALQLEHAILGLSHDETADLFPADGVSSLLFQLRVQLDRIFVDTGHAVARAQTADQTGGVPGSAAAEFALFEQDDVFPAELRQVIGNARPDHTA